MCIGKRPSLSSTFFNGEGAAAARDNIAERRPILPKQTFWGVIGEAATNQPSSSKDPFSSRPVKDLVCALHKPFFHSLLRRRRRGHRLIRGEDQKGIRKRWTPSFTLMGLRSNLLSFDLAVHCQSCETLSEFSQIKPGPAPFLLNKAKSAQFCAPP